jgi:hypothetical protein
VSHFQKQGRLSGASHPAHFQQSDVQEDLLLEPIVEIVESQKRVVEIVESRDNREPEKGSRGSRELR